MDLHCIGTVKFFLSEKGWGRLQISGPLPDCISESDNAVGIFVHCKDVVMPDDKILASLEEGMEVSFSLAKSEKGWQAQEVRGADGAPVRIRLHRNLLQGFFRGAVTHWNEEKGFGWIATDLSPQTLGMQRVPKSVLAMNDGRVYFRSRDCGAREGQEVHVQKGRAVVFQLYWDEKGLGAVQVCDATTLRPLTRGADNYRQLVAIQELPIEEQLIELTKEIKECLVFLLVNRAQAGNLIGQKGENVKALKADANVDRIYIENGVADHRQVEIKGSPSNVVDAVLRIAEHLHKEPGNIEPLTGSSGADLQVQLVVPEDGFGRVVGKGKAHISAIEEKCAGAKLQITPKVAVGAGYAVQAVAISGSASALAEAVKHLVVRIIACCSVSPLSRGHTGLGPMMMSQQLGAPLGGKGGYGGFSGNPYGAIGWGGGWGSWKGKGGSGFSSSLSKGSQPGSYAL